MNVLELISHSEEETAALAEKLAPSFLAGDTVILSGELGSGKTTFVRSLVKARGIDGSMVSSPSYSIINEYKSGEGEPEIYHFDFYRINDSSELTEIGWEDYLNREGIILAEWGEKAAGFLPDHYYQIAFETINENERKITITLVAEQK